MPAVDPRLFRAIVEAASDAILSTSPDGVIESWNGGAERLFGYSAEEAIGTHCLRLVPREHRRRALEMVRRVAGGGEIEAIEAERLGRDGDVVDISLTASPMRDEGGSVIGAAIVIRDISSHKDLENRLREMALRDPLTGLYNRRQFEVELERQLALSRRNGGVGAVLVMDLDDFKSVNDTYGHAAGDEVLRAVSEVLTQRLRGSDLLARIGGDEFAAILPDVPGDRAIAVARGLEDRIRGIRRGPGQTISTSASIGVASYAGRLPVSSEDLLQQADAAMYARKRDQVPFEMPDDVKT